MNKLTFFLLCAVALVLAPKSYAQVGADPGFGLLFIDCNGNIISVNGASEEGAYCGNNFGPATFGSATTTVSGQCEVTLMNIGAVQASASWTGCSTPLIGQTEGGIDDHLAVDPDCGEVNVGLIWANASVANFFLGTIISQGRRGWADCTGDSTPPVPPRVDSC